MSYILDALKKVEHEKLKKSAPGGMTSMVGDLFQEKQRPPATGGKRKIAVLVTVVCLMTFAGSWLLFRDNNPKSTLHSSPVASSVVAPAFKPADSPVVTPAALVPPSTLPASPSPPPTTMDDDDRPARSIKTVSKHFIAPAAPLLLKSSPPKIQAPADMKLSGIAWQDDHNARRAVVNGFLLKEGGVVSGARISEILTDRVRFTNSGGTFELRLDSVPATELRQ